MLKEKGMRCFLLYSVLFGFVILTITGCTTRSDFSAISSKNVSLNNLQLDPAKSKGRSSGEDCQTIIIIIPDSGPPVLDEAIDQALEAKGGNILTDAVVVFTSWYIPYIVGMTCWDVEGDVYDTFE